MDKYGQYGQSDSSDSCGYANSDMTFNSESCDSLLSTESTYGSYRTWTGKDTNGYDADVESNVSV